MAGESGAEVDFVADIEGAEDADDAERSGLEDVDGGTDVDDAGGSAGVDDAGRDAGRDRRSRLCILCRSGTVAPMQRYAASKEQWLRCRGSEDHVDADIEGVEDVDDTERRGVGGIEPEPRLCVEGA